MQSSLHTKLAVFVIIGTVLTSSYFIYFWYQSQQYVDQVMPLYRSLELLGRDEDKLTTADQRPEDLFPETERIARSAEELKVRCRKIPPANTRSENVTETYINATDKLLAWNQANKDFLLAKAQDAKSPNTASTQKLVAEKQAQSAAAGDEYRKIMKTQLSKILGITR